MRAVIDFPSAFDSTAKRLTFSKPIDVVYAHDIADVVPALERVAAAAAAGLWAAGFITYEAAPAFESAMRVRNGGIMPLLAFGLYATSDDPHGVSSNAEIRSAAPAPAWAEQTSEDEFANALSAIHQAIMDGETYQVNYTNRLRAEFTGDAFAWYESLRVAQGSGWHAFMETERFSILSASPEMFFEVRDKRIATRPMKGTARRGRFRTEDEEMKRALLASPKERAENLMIVDLLRNDVGRIAQTGTVEVPELFTPERYETVWQLTSRVEALLGADVTLVDVFRALFPCGSVTGAPKINTMAWIADLEDSPREIYCGAMGVVRPGGDCAFNVPIRTVWIDRDTGRAEYGVGSGITIDSNKVDELNEFRAKALVLTPTRSGFELLETMRLEEGSILRRSRHVQRLQDSAHYFGFEFDAASLEHALDDACSAASPGSWRVRVLLKRSGAFAVDASVPAPARFATPSSCRSLDAREGVSLSRVPVASDDPFLCNKTTHRDVYDRARASAPSAFDVLLWNERDEITEFTIGNVVVELDGSLFTPDVRSGLLGGVFRSSLIDDGIVQSRVIARSELASASRMWLVNSLREWVEVELASA